VAAVDRGEEPSKWIRTAQFIAGDAAALLLFATIGRANHHEALSFSGSLETGFPFLMGWFLTAPFTGAFSSHGGNPRTAAMAAAKSWAIAAPLGIILRSIGKGYIPEKTFVIVSLVATAVLLVGWRTALAAVSSEAKELSPQDQMKRRSNKKGNPLEFINLLMSLTKRW